MTQLQAANSSTGRAPFDLYETPHDVTAALMPWLKQYRFPLDIWEPACGHGAIATMLRCAGYSVFASDIVDYGYGVGRRDFLSAPLPHATQAIVTNPPWGFAQRFVERAVLELGAPYVAMLLKDTFWQAKARDALWGKRPPTAILQLTWRPDFTGSRSPYFGCCWSVWTPDYSGVTSFIRGGKPT